MATDPRLELARRMVASGQGVARNSPSSLQQRAAAQYAALSAKKKTGGSSAVTGPGGWKGIVAAALDNPIAKTALSPLRAIDFGRAGVISGLKEIADSIDMNDATKGSFGQFISQTQNNIGFGDVIAEGGGLGNKWLDRIAGFAGDVAFDPTTYLTLGAGHLAGMAGRVNLAADIASQGAKNVSAGRITQEALDELVQRAGSKGIGKLTQAERAAYGLPEQGVRFMGRKIAGSERVAGAVGGKLADFRYGVTESAPFQKAFRTKEGMLRRAPDNLEQAYTKLATGRGKMSATQAANLVASETEKAAKGGAFAGTWGRVAHSMFNKERNPVRNAQLINDIERGVLQDDTASAAAKFLEDVRVAHAQATGKEIPKRENYFPHMWTRTGRKLLAGDDAVSQDLRRIVNLTVNEVNDLGFALERKINAGTYKIGGKQVTFREGTIDDINRTLKREFPDVVKDDVISTELPYVLGQYVKSVGTDVGNVAFVDKLKRLGTAVGSREAVTNVVDTKATAEANAQAAKEFKKSLDGGKAAFDEALKTARTSTAEAVKNINTTLKLRVSGLRSQDAQLMREWERLQSVVVGENIKFDAAVAEINSRQLDLQDQLLRAEDDARRLTERYQDDIARSGADERQLTKDRLELRRQAKQRVEEAQARVDELRAHMDAYDDLKSQLDQAKREVDSFEKITTGDLPPEVRDIVRQRTVAEQRAVAETLRPAAEVVDQAVRIGGGSAGDEAVALSKRLRIDVKAAGSVLAQTLDSAARHIDTQFAVELGRLRNLLDDVWGTGSPVSAQALAAEEDRITKMAERLRTLKASLEEKVSRGAAQSSINATESQVRTLEQQIQVAYEQFAAMSASNQGAGRLVRGEVGFNPGLPADARTQALKQLESDVAKVKQAVVASALSQGYPQYVADAQADLFERAFKAMEVSVRYGKDNATAGAYVVAANNALEDAVFKARISTDYFNRRAMTLSELEKQGINLSEAQARQIDHVVMMEVMRSERRSVQEQVGRLIGNLENYTAKNGRALDPKLAKSKNVNLAKQRVDQVYDWISGYIDEVKQTMDDADRRVFNLGAREEGTVEDFVDDVAASGGQYRVAEGAGVQTRGAVFKVVSSDVREAIALAITQDAKAAKSLAKSKNMDVLLSRIANGNPKQIKKAIEDELIRVIGGATTTAQKQSESWYALAAQATARQIDVLRGKEQWINSMIDRLEVSPGFRPGSPQALETERMYRSFLDDVVSEIRSLGRNITDEQRQRLYYYKNLWESALSSTKQVGVAPRMQRLSPEQVIAGQVKLNAEAVSANKQLAETWQKMLRLEGEVEKIFSTSPLARSVKEVPGRKGIFAKANNLIAVIDEELGTLNQRLKGLKGQARKPVLEYVRELRDQRATLVRHIEQATPLEDRLASGEVALREAKQELRALTGKGEAEVAAAARTAKLRARLDGVASRKTATEAKIAAERAALEVEQAGVREQFDATVKAARDALGTVEEARSAVENMIPAVEQVLKNIPNVKGMRNSAHINEVYEWLVEAYDLIDPDGLVQRMMNMPQDMTPDMLKPNGALGSGLSQREMVTFLKQLPNDPSARVALALIYKAQQDAGNLLMLVSQREADQQMLRLAKDGKLFSVLKQVVKDGFEEIASTGVYVPTEVAEAMQRVISLDQRASRQWIDTMNYYVDLWKSIKTTSPRFHIRNAMSATFMNMVAGVRFENMKVGAKIFREFEKDPLNWLDNVDPKYRPYAQDIIDAVFGSGGGQYAEIDNAATRLSDRGVFRYSKMKGTTVEGTVRAGMAAEYLLPPNLGGRGSNVQNAVSAIEKYHFNYSKLSKLDRNARAFIPFWTFMSRNIPLQIEQMWLNPRAYAVYNSFVRNIRAEEEGDVTPKWISEVGGFKLPFGDNLYATPDIGMNRLGQDIEQLRNPIRFGQNLNPVLKTLLEVYSGRQFYKDIPISGDRFTQLEGARRVAEPLAQLMGQLERGPSGEPLVSEKFNYALLQLLPGLQEAERLIAPSMESYKEKATQSRVSFFTGLPVTKVGPQQILGEQLRQKREAEKKKARERAIRRAVEQ